jgi:hypothetical protein
LHWEAADRGAWRRKELSGMLMLILPWPRF